MSYRTMQQHLRNVFNQNNFQGVWQEGETQKSLNRGRNPNINTLRYDVPNDYGLDLVINYPGMKTTRKGNVFAYDYRVDMNGIAISHANIIVDLYNKALQLNGNTDILVSFLLDLAVNGDDYTRANHQLLFNQDFTVPDEELIAYVNREHRRLGKAFPQEGNRWWNYSSEQLAHLIMWIVLQEDLNYPMPRFEGRRMPFYRYLEAIHCAQYPNRSYTLAHVIERALSHTRPRLWEGSGINYAPIRNLA